MAAPTAHTAVEPPLAAGYRLEGGGMRAEGLVPSDIPGLLI